MATRYETITLDRIAGEAMDMVNEATALRPGDELRPVVVERLESGRLLIVDGFHRTAGFVRWAREEEAELKDVEVKVLVADDPGLVASAAEPGPRQREALNALYALAD